MRDNGIGERFNADHMCANVYINIKMWILIRNVDYRPLRSYPWGI